MKVSENNNIVRLAKQLGVEHDATASLEYWAYPFIEALAVQLAALEVKVADLEQELKKRGG